MSGVERSDMAISTRMTLTESHQLEARRAPVDETVAVDYDA